MYINNKIGGFYNLWQQLDFDKGLTYIRDTEVFKYTRTFLHENLPWTKTHNGWTNQEFLVVRFPYEGETRWLSPRILPSSWILRAECKNLPGNFKFVKWFLAKVYFFIRRGAVLAGLWGTCWHQSRSLSRSWNLERKVKSAKTYHRKSKRNGRTNQRFLAIIFCYKRRDCNCSEEHGDCDDRDREVCPHSGLWE